MFCRRHLPSLTQLSSYRAFLSPRRRMVVSCRIESRFRETNRNLDMCLSANTLDNIFHSTGHTHISETDSGILFTIPSEVESSANLLRMYRMISSFRGIIDTAEASPRRCFSTSPHTYGLLVMNALAVGGALVSLGEKGS